LAGKPKYQEKTCPSAAVITTDGTLAAGVGSSDYGLRYGTGLQTAWWTKAQDRDSWKAVIEEART
jgi:hypothetical protein